MIDEKGGLCAGPNDNSCGKNIRDGGAPDGDAAAPDPGRAPGDADDTVLADRAGDMPANLPDAPVGDGIDADAVPDIPPEPNPDADSGSDADADTDTDGDGHPDVEAGPDGDGGPDVPDAEVGEINCHTNRTEPPVTACINGSCLPLSEDVRNGMVLWLDPSNLGPPNTDVAIWCDQSGQRNDALASNDDARPFVARGGGVTLVAHELGAGFYVPHNDSLDLGSDDFTLLVVAGINQEGTGKTLFSKASGERTFPKQVVLESNYAGPQGFRPTGHVNETQALFDTLIPGSTERLYGLRKVGTQIEVRVNGTRTSAVPLLTPGVPPDNLEDLYLGISGPTDPTWIDTLRAVIFVHGSLTDDEVGGLETHLLRSFNLL